MEAFGRTVAGRTFKRGSTVFMVLGVQSYPRERIHSRFERVLRVPRGTLVAVSYRGTFIPNIVVQGGVVRLTRVAVLGSILSTPKAISEALGIKQDYHPYELQRVG